MAHCVAISGSSFESQGVDINLNVWCIMDAFLALQNTTEGTNIQSNTHTHTHTQIYNQVNTHTHTHTVTKGSDEIKVMYTNIDGIISRKLELIDYLKEKKPEIVWLTETKLCEEIQTNIENDNYNIQRKDRKDKKGGGVLLMIKSKIRS